MQAERRSVWKSIAVGTLFSILAVVAALIAFLVVGQRMAGRVASQAADPALRVSLAREILRVDRLPEGWEPTIVVGIPLLGRVVVLEGPLVMPEATGAVGPGRFFLYLDRDGNASERDLTEDLDRLLDVRGLDLGDRQPLAAGDSGAISYRSMRARLNRRPSGGWPVLAATLELRCSPGEAAALGVWIERDPAPEWEADEIDLSGTPADPDAINSFLSSAGLCRPDAGASS